MPDEAVNYFDQPLRRFCEDTAARQPTPGGGSVAALSAVLGCNVARMVCAYTLANAKLAAAHPSASRIDEKLARCAEMLRRLVAEDMDAYTAYAAAQRDQSAAAETVARRRAATIAAVAVPLEIAVLAASALRACDEVQADASKYLLSDLLAAAHLLCGAAHAAAANARLNLKQVDDDEIRSAYARQLAASLDQADASRESIARGVTTALDLPA